MSLTISNSLTYLSRLKFVRIMTIHEFRNVANLLNCTEILGSDPETLGKIASWLQYRKSPSLFHVFVLPN